jgi:hypothetical protein
MLGFSPLADTALADDAPVAGGAPAVDTNRDNFAFLLSGPVGALVVGAVRDAAVQQQDQVSLTPSAILAGAPVVATVSLSSAHDVAGDDIVTAAPVVASVDMSSQQDLSAVGIVTAAPVLGTPLAEDIPPFVVNGIVTGAPTFTGTVDTLGSIDAYVRALYAAGANDSNTSRFQFSPDGTKYFLLTSTSGRPPQRYDLTTPWNVGTGTLVNSNNFNITTTHSIQDFQLSDDGLYIAFLMWANSDGKSSIHLYSLDEPFVTNYAGLVSSAASDDGYTFVRSFIIDQGYRRIRAFRHFDGKLYTVDAPLTQNSTLQRRTVNNALFSSLGVFNNTLVEASTLTTTVTGYSIAFLSLDGTSRIYHDIAAYDPLTLAQLEVSGQTLGFNVKYQLKPDGIGILTPNLAEIDTDTSVILEQFEPLIAVGIVTGQPVLEQGDLDQQHTFAPLAVLTGTPVIAATLVTQNINIAANDIVSGNPVVGQTSFTTNSEISLNAITTSPVLVGTVTPEVIVVVALSGNNVVSGNPVVGETSVATDSELSLNAVTTVPAVVGQIVVSEENNIILDTVVAGTPSLGSQSVAQQHPLLSSPVVSNVPEVSASELKEKYDLLAQGVTTGDPTVGQVTVTQDHTIVSAPVQTGPVIVNNITIFGAEDTVLSVILVGTPVVTSPDITQTHNISTQGVVSTAPQVGPVAVEQTSSFQNFIAVPVLTQEPVVEDVDSVVTYSFDTVSITFSPPLVGISFLNGATRRVVDVSADTRNFANTNTTRNGAVLNVVYS